VRYATGGPQIAGEIADAVRQPSHQITMAEQERLMAERHASLRQAFGRLSSCCQRLLTLLIDEPPMSDTEISARLGVPVGSIGPTRSRCLEKLRRDPAIAALTQYRNGTM
jgi:DNA-directed RNA polymerase specialized sigma24 family protein